VILKDNEVIGIFPARSGQNGLTPSEMNPLLNSIIYSTNEKQTGIWVDKRIVYSKTLVINTPLNVGSNNIIHGITNLDKIINLPEGYFITSTYTGIFPSILFQESPADSPQVFVSGWDNTNIRILVGSLYTGFFEITNLIITIKYIKTS